MMINFALAAVMVAGGIWFLRASFAAKGFCAMAALTLASSTVMLTRTPASVSRRRPAVIAGPRMPKHPRNVGP